VCVCSLPLASVNTDLGGIQILILVCVCSLPLASVNIVCVCSLPLASVNTDLGGIQILILVCVCSLPLASVNTDLGGIQIHSSQSTEHAYVSVGGQHRQHRSVKFTFGNIGSGRIP